MQPKLLSSASIIQKCIFLYFFPSTVLWYLQFMRKPRTLFRQTLTCLTPHVLQAFSQMSPSQWSSDHSSASRGGRMSSGRAAMDWQIVMPGVWTGSTAWLGMQGHKQGCQTSDSRDFLWVAVWWTGNNGCFSACGRISGYSQVLGGWRSQLTPTQKMFLLLIQWKRTALTAGPFLLHSPSMHQAAPSRAHGPAPHAHRHCTAADFFPPVPAGTRNSVIADKADRSPK